MYRITTPTHTYTLPMTTSSLKEIVVTYKQTLIPKIDLPSASVTITKHYQDGTLPSGMTLDDKKVIIRLTQEETKQFDAKFPIVSQVRVLTNDDDSYASQYFQVDVENVLNEEVLS